MAMPNPLHTHAAGSTKQPSTARRTVWGCLTCRRRKVKCHSRDTPCEACRRLHLPCTSSFSSNFKQYEGSAFQSRPIEGETLELVHCQTSQNSWDDFDLTPFFLSHPWTPRLIDDHTLISHYKHNLSCFFSVKSARSASWSFYSYAILSAEALPQSPLRHSILAWTAAHLVLQNQNQNQGQGQGQDYNLSGHTQLHHYSQACAVLNGLRADLAAEASVSAPPIASLARKLKMLLAASLFLTYYHVLSGDIDSLTERLASLAELLRSHWPCFREALGTLEARILVWLAYLDLRASLWTRQTSTKRNGQLFHFLVNHVGFSALRSARQGRHYLTECFGSALPLEELNEDLLQEPAKLLSDEILSVFATLRELETGVDDTSRESQMLRLTKIQAIRADISRIRTQSQHVHASLLQFSSGPDHKMRSEFHRLVTTAMYLSATILLNRIVAPHIRTDDEAQAAAREIVQIARTLHTSGFVCSPRSLVWPLPVFVAGIEVTDWVYQDWVLDYLVDVASWGASASKTRELLQRIIARQEAQNCRVKVWDMISELGEAVMI